MRDAWRRRLLADGLMLAGIVGVVLAVELLALLLLGRLPRAEERTVLVVATLAGIIGALATQPIRRRVQRVVRQLVGSDPEAPRELLDALGTRLTGPMPIDELLVDLAESLRRSLLLEAAEVWTGSEGGFERVVSDPERGPARIALSMQEEAVLTRGDVYGPDWLAVWLPALQAGRAGHEVRLAPMVSGGRLHGLIVAERPGGGARFDERDERVLLELARQVGFAIHNVRLAAQLQASLDQVRRQSEELRASRARVVSAGDAERRRIERDLHDGAQQRLVALIANLRLARELARSDPAEGFEVLEGLGTMGQEALTELRELAQGIYPPLLADRGLPDALAAAALRAPLDARVDVRVNDRQPADVEATVYFCCLEALQNVSKHAGAGATAAVRVVETGDWLRFEIADDGLGFEPETHAFGAGLTNMADRLGALGGTLTIESDPARGTQLVGAIPLTVRARTGTSAPP
jgi:signal transduction histidine kinase